MTYSFLNITLNNDNTVENWTSDIIVEQYSTDTIIRVAYKNIDPNHYVYIMFESNGVRKIMKPTVEFAMKGVVGKTFAYQLTQYETQYYVGSKNFSIIIQSASGTMIATKEFSFKMKKMPYAVFENLNLNTDSSLVGVAKGVEDNARDIANLAKLIGGLTIGDTQSDWNETDKDSKSYIKNKPTKLSQFENDIGISGGGGTIDLSNYYKKGEVDTKLNDKLSVDDAKRLFVDKSVNDLVNYYTKNEVYSKVEVSNLINTVPKFTIKIVDKLPENNISLEAIYLLKKTSSAVNDYYEEYIYVGGGWELIGNTSVKLSDYYTKEEVDNLLKAITGGTFEGYYNKSEINTLLSNKVSIATLNDYYDKSTVNTLLNKKANTSDLVNYASKDDISSAVDRNTGKINYVYSNGTMAGGKITFPTGIKFKTDFEYIFDLHFSTNDVVDDSYKIQIVDSDGTAIGISDYKDTKQATFGDFKQIVLHTGVKYFIKFHAYCSSYTVNSSTSQYFYTDALADIPEVYDWALAENKPTYTPSELGVYSKSEVDTKIENESVARNDAINTAINSLVDGAPDAMNTLKELSDAIGAHKDVTDALNAAIGKKVDKETGKGLSTNDYTTDEKNKLAGIEAGAQVNPTKISVFENDGNGLSPYATEDYVQVAGGKIDSITLNGVKLEIVDKNVQINETDPTVPSWAKAATKPTYTAEEVDAYSKAETNLKLEAIENTISSNKTDADDKIGKLDNRLKPIEAAVGDGGSIDTRIANAVKVETDRALAAESALDTNLTTKITTALGTAKSYTDSAVARDNLVNILGEASVSLNGLLSKEDKRRLDAIYAVFGENPDEDTFVNTINEVLAIFSKYPEGTNIVDYLATKVNISDIVDNLTSDEIAKPLSAKQGKVLDGKITTEATTRATNDQALSDRLTPIEEAVGTGGSIDVRIANAVKAEADRAKGVESTLQSSINAVADDLSDEVTRATGAESTLQTAVNTNKAAIEAESKRATDKEAELNTAITNLSDTVASNKSDIESKLSAEVDKVKNGTTIAGKANAIVDYINKDDIRFTSDDTSKDYIISKTELTSLLELMSKFGANEYN